MPTPCGPNSQCQVRGETFACSCLENYIGVPPNCRPECTINPECPPQLACMQQRCRNPCDGICGVNAQCSVVNHNAVCSCNENFKGDPFSLCQPVDKGKYAAKTADYQISYSSPRAWCCFSFFPSVPLCMLLREAGKYRKSLLSTVPLLLCLSYLLPVGVQDYILEMLRKRCIIYAANMLWLCVL